MITAVFLFAATVAAQPIPSDYIEVTATKIEEDLVSVPASVTVLTREQLERTGARDLSTALANVAGVAVARGGDAGPAGSIPELWGLREADAFLLIVDGVPWGSAFNPPTEAIDLEDVERIEIVRGSAPVVYGATAFSGVIQVIRSSEAKREATLSVGSFGSAAASVVFGNWSALAERERFRDDRAGADRARVSYRNELTTQKGQWHFDADLLRLEQKPFSPHPRQGRVLSPRVELDANHNPEGAQIDETRLHLATTYTTSLNDTPWITTAALTHTKGDVLRGFLADIASGESEGFQQDRTITELYLDTRIVKQVNPTLRLLAGADYTGGRAEADSELFEYEAGEERGVTDEKSDLEDTRNFAAIYAQGEWSKNEAWRVTAGARLNHAREHRDEESFTATRGSGFFGVSRKLFADTWLFADYRNTFKPALIDFSPAEEEEGELLEPETSKSYELGLKGRGARYFWQASAFTMDMGNLVVSQEVNGLPSLTNGGQIRFKGFETELHVAPVQNVDLFATYARHDGRFRDFVQNFDGVLTQLRGRRFEMTPSSLASFGASFRSGPWSGAATAHYTGPRWLNKRNTALAKAFTTVDASLGWKNFRLTGTNLTNRRDPIAESELGDAQYYRMQARALRISYTLHL